MERGRIDRYYRSRGGFNQRRFSVNGQKLNQSRSNQNKICLRCFQTGHWRGADCESRDPKVACGSCFRMNYFSVDCPHCTQKGEISFSDGMTLRLSDHPQPRPYIDVIFGDKTYPALINTSIFRSRINLEALEVINQERRHAGQNEIQYPGLVNYTIRRRHREFNLVFAIRPTQRNPITVGMDFLFKTGFSFTVDRVCINQRSAVTKTPTTIDFLYNRPQGRNLAHWLQNMNSPMYHSYEQGTYPVLKEEPEVTISNEYYQSEDSEEDNQDDVLNINLDDDDRRMLDD